MVCDLGYVRVLLLENTLSREDFKHGQSTIQDFFAWMDKRHEIYLKRYIGEPKPWTEDVILRDFKFTNVFRELDRGTLALRDMELEWVRAYQGKNHALIGVGDIENCGELIETAGQLIVFNTWWYRLFNWWEHAISPGGCGFVTNYAELYEYMKGLHVKGARIFTAAHMVRGVGGRKKVFPYLELCARIWEDRAELAVRYAQCTTLQQGFDICREYYLIGDFTAYELVSDFRHNILSHATDILTWANPGNGAIRGLRRLGLAPTVASIKKLRDMSGDNLNREIFAGTTIEMREIEHCLCEFDKYERCRTGLGRPRQLYNGRY